MKNDKILIRAKGVRAALVLLLKELDNLVEELGNEDV